MADETKHSPEPWQVHEQTGDHGHWGWFVKSGTSPNGVCGFATQPDARRIVACVNALAGVPTEVLEARANETDAQKYDRLLGELDDLWLAMSEAERGKWRLP